jgi:hypothetical protein
MFLYAPDFFLNVPGAIMLMLGLLLTLALAGGPREFVGIGLNLHWMLLGMTLATLGYTALVMGLLARIYYDFDAKTRERWKHIVTYDRGVLSGFALMAAGIVLNSVLLYSWLRAGRRLDEVSHPAIFGLLLIILGFLTFTFTLLLQIIAQGRGKRQEGSG